jgi:hypothetical protein
MSQLANRISSRVRPSMLSRHRWLPLTVILAVQAVLALRLIWSNTAFSDEALYTWSGWAQLNTLLHGTLSGQQFPAYFSGAPPLYPPLAAVANALGGLAGARLLSLAFMLGATGLLYLTTARLLDRTAAAGAALVFVLLSSVQFLSALATYDAMALFLLALSAWLVIRSPAVVNPDYGESLLVLAGIVLALADAVKYATALWDPVVIALVILRAPGPGWKKAVLRAVRLTIYTVVPAGLALLAGGSSYLAGIGYTTTARAAGTTPASLVLHESFTWTWPVLTLAVAAVAVAVTKGQRKTSFLLGLMTAAVLLAPLHGVQSTDDTSLYKHVTFGAWFGAVAAGYLLAQVSRIRLPAGRVRWLGGLAGAAVVLVAAGLALAAYDGIGLVNAQYIHGWPDTSQVTTDIDALLPASGCPCLAMSNAVADYYAIGKVPAAEDNFTGPWYLSYGNLTGTPAYVSAIRAHYFHVVELDLFDGDAPLVTALSQAMAATPGYHLAYSVPVAGYPGTVQVWQYQADTFGDEFSGPPGGAPSPAVWSYNRGSGYGKGELETYTSSRANSFLDGQGHLVLTLTRTGKSYNSARLVSKAAITEGTVIAARIQLDVARGAWPAWWLLGPGDATELDMLENYGSSAAVQATAWNGAARPATAGKTGSTPVSPGWHTYQVAWTASGLTFSRDGRPYLVVSAQQAKAWGYDAGRPMSMILNIAAGGPAGTPPASVKFPVTMKVDWIRAWKD